MVGETSKTGPHQLVAFLLNRARYALPLSCVERVLPMVAVSPLPQAPAIVCGVINLHGRVLPVLDLRRRFGLPPGAYGPDAHLVVARTARRPVVLPVDEALGVLSVAVDAVTAPTAVLPGIGQVSGIVALPDGLLFLQDLDAFLALDEERALAAALPDGARPAGGDGPA